MELSFNIAGPCIPGEHYMLPPAARLGRVMELIEQRAYFTLHAGRQFGKTTALRWLVSHLNSGSDCYALWVDVEAAREIPDPDVGVPIIVEKLERARSLQTPELPAVDIASGGRAQTAVLRALGDLCSRADRPLVVFFDEADGLVGATMTTFLTQLREGYISRTEAPFPSALALVGLRQVRDYVLDAEQRRNLGWLGTTSPFNVTAEATTLRPFSAQEVEELLGQHTLSTGQVFSAEAGAQVFELSQGHPWLVNALARAAVSEEVPDQNKPVAAAHVDSAKETLIRERRTNIDSLVARLREPRVERVIRPMLVGDFTGQDVMSDDFSYVVGLGLIARKGTGYEIANPIYREVIPRALSFDTQLQIRHDPQWYVDQEGQLDMPKLVAAWQKFWRRDGHLAAEGFGYKEAGPHLMMLAFLQRIVNGGGRIDREYGLGKRAMDLHVEFAGSSHAIELKLRRHKETEAEGIEQLSDYMDRLGVREGWLVLFDLRDGQSWEEKVFQRTVEQGGMSIHVVGC